MLGAGAPRGPGRGLDLPAAAGVDLGFERVDGDGGPRGWSLGDGAVVDGRVALEGVSSLRLEAGGGRGARATLRLPPPPFEGNRVRFVLHARAGDGAEVLELLLRIDGPDGLLYVDRRSTPLGSAADAWQRVVLEAPVFESAESLRLSVSMARGTAWIDAVAVEACADDLLASHWLLVVREAV